MKKNVTLALAAVVMASTAFAAPQPAEARSNLLQLSALITASMVVASVHTVGNIPESLIDGSSYVVESLKPVGKASVMMVKDVSTGIEYSLTVPKNILGHASGITGNILTASTSASGTMLTNAGKAIAFVPNEISKSLIHHSRH